MYVDLYASVTSSGGPVGGTGTIQARFQNAVTPNTAENAVATIQAIGLVGVSWTAVYTQGSAATAPTGPTAGTGMFSNQVVSLPSGSEVTVTQIVSVPSAATIEDHTISAWILPSVSDTLVSPAHNESNSFFAVYHRTIALEVTKELIGSVQPGGTAQFTVLIRNTDTVDLPVASVLTEILPDGFSILGWTAVYTGGSGGPAAGVSLPITLSPIPAGGSTLYTIAMKVSHCVAPGALTNTARLTLPSGYTTTAHSKCIDAPLEFVVDPITPSPCRQFGGGGVASVQCDGSATFSGTVTITLKSKTGKVWVPFAPACGGGYGRQIPVGTYEVVQVNSSGCWESQYSYIPNGDLVDGDCTAEDGAAPSTSYVIVETITMTIPGVGGAADITLPFTATYEVRLYKGVTYAPVINVAQLAQAQAA